MQTAFAVQVAGPPVWSLTFSSQISHKWSLLSFLCWQTYSHSSQTPSFHSCSSSATVTKLQQLHFFLCFSAVWVHSSVPVCLLESTFPYGCLQIVQTAFSVQVAVPPVWSLIFLLQTSQKWSLLSSLCWQTYLHSLHFPSFHSWSSSATVTKLQQLHFFLCVFAILTHSSAAPVCLQIYPHSLQIPFSQLCAASLTVTRLQQLHFFLCVFAVWTHSSAPVCLQLYWHTLQIPFSHLCKAQLSCACSSSFTGHASSVHWCQWYVSLFDQASVCECSWHFTFFSCSELSAYLPFFIAFHCSVVPR